MRKLAGKHTGIVALGVLAVVVGLAMGFDPSDAAVLVRAQIIAIG